MLRSMYSAISGMQGFETKLDVIGNNIANVNTTGFKASRVDFSDVLSQTMTGASGPVNNGLGGTNPKQVGLGVKVAAIPLLFTQGADETTGNPLDVAINGSGLFVVTSDGGTTQYYTRAGDFSLDANDNLVLPNGMIVMGVEAGNKGTLQPLQPVNLTTFANAYSWPNNVSMSSSPDLQIGTDGSLTVTGTDGKRYTIGYLVLATFSNPSGLQKSGDSTYQASADSGQLSYQLPQQNNTGSLMPGALEMSNVDLTREFTEMIVAQRGFDANSHVIGTANAILQDIVNLKNS